MPLTDVHTIADIPAMKPVMEEFQAELERKLADKKIKYK
jgi:hypothetical protein